MHAKPRPELHLYVFVPIRGPHCLLLPSQTVLAVDARAGCFVLILDQRAAPKALYVRCLSVQARPPKARVSHEIATRKDLVALYSQSVGLCFTE